jgi:hypothetical protein
MADGVHEVGFAESYAAVHEKRIVGFGGQFRDGQRRGVSKPVGRPDDERIERVLGVQHVHHRFFLRRLLHN